MKKVVQYWKADYNWRNEEDKLNRYPQFKTSIEGIEVHFLRVRPQSSIKGNHWRMHEGRQDAPRPGSKFFHFHAVFGKKEIAK